MTYATYLLFFFFFQAEDGIRDYKVTGVQTCALPICASATCKSCAHCPWMAMNGLANLAEALETGANEIHIDPEIGRRAYRPIDRMLAFAEGSKVEVRASGDLARDGALFSNVGPAGPLRAEF